MPVAKLLGVDAPLSDRPRYPIEFERTTGMNGDTIEIDIPSDSAMVGRPVSGMGLPEDVLILLIRRGGEFIVPKGRTLLQPYDTLLLLAGKDALHEAGEIILRSANRPDEPPTEVSQQDG